MSDVQVMYEHMLPMFDSPAVFDRPVTWHRVGKNGYLHAARFCSKLSRAQNQNLTEKTLSVNEAIRKRTCPACFQNAMFASTASRSQTEELYHLRMMLSRDNFGSLPDDYPLYHLLLQLTRYRNALYFISRVENSLGTVHDAKNAFEEAKQQVHETWKLLSSMQQARRLEIMQNVSTIYVGYLEDLSQCTSLQERSFLVPEPNISYQSVRILFDHWASLHQSGGSHEECFQYVRKYALSHMKFLSESQMADVPSVTRQALQSTSHAACREDWNLHLPVVLTSVVAKWEAERDAFLSEEEHVTLGVYSTHFSSRLESVHALLEVYTISVNHANGTRILRVPARLASWLRVYVQDDLMGFTPSWQLVKEDLDSKVLETISVLWDPSDEESPFRMLEDCVLSAKALV